MAVFRMTIGVDKSADTHFFLILFLPPLKHSLGLFVGVAILSASYAAMEQRSPFDE